MNAMDMFATVFMSLNIAFLLATAVWFRLDHATPKRQSNRFEGKMAVELVQEVQWQYSLRSNLLISVCVLSAYLVYLQELQFLLICFTGLSAMNVITDYFYVYEVHLHPIVAKGHLMAGGVITLVTVAFLQFRS
mmetsp:Transcript_25109/g.51062  ORF Transcript_25109/g.51062 Transcript_25109/m.51062 type:complete len:134 (-) Transcript_25109:774-1175(-)